MSKLLNWLKKLFVKHSPSKEWLNSDSIIPVDKGQRIVKIPKCKGVIIQFNSILKVETIKLLKEDIQNQIKENGFAVVDNRCKIIEFDNPKFIVEIK